MTCAPEDHNFDLGMHITQTDYLAPSGSLGIQYDASAAITLGAVWTFNNLNVVWLVSNGGAPADQTHILVSYVYKAVFNLYQYGCFQNVFGPLRGC